MLPHSRANIIQDRAGLATQSVTFSNRDSRSDAYIQFRAGETTSPAIGCQSDKPTATTYPSISDVCTEAMPRSRSHEAVTRAKHDDLLKLRANMTACLINNATRGCTPFFVPLEDDGNRNLRSRLAHYHSKELEIILSIRQSLEVDQQGWPLCASHVLLEIRRLGREIEMDEELGCSPQDILLQNIRHMVNLVEEITAKCQTACECNFVHSQRTNLQSQLQLK